jgi:hypothetical protein
MDLDQVAHELYGLDPADFTGRRDALSREARQDGRRDLAGAIKVLRRPSMAAYTVNLMVRSHGEEIDRLIELGGRLREAQETLSGEDIRALGRQRSQLIAGVAKQARQQAADAGHPIGDAVQREVEATLEAALADPKAAGAVRTGRLIRGLERTGMEPVDLTGAVAGSASTPTGVTGVRAEATQVEGPAEATRAEAAQAERRTEARRRQVEAAQAAATAAEQDAAAAEAARDAAVSEHEAAAQRRTDVDAEVQRLNDLLRQARDQADRAESEERSARRRRRDAEEAADQARREADRKRAALGDLDR